MVYHIAYVVYHIAYGLCVEIISKDKEMIPVDRSRNWGLYLLLLMLSNNIHLTNIFQVVNCHL